VQTPCLSAADLLDAALHAPGKEPQLGHLDTCDVCRTEVRRLRETVRAVRATAALSTKPGQPCLSDTDIARLVEGAREALESASPHLVVCPACRQRLADLSTLLEDDEIHAEVVRLGQRRTPALHRRLVVTAGGAALAAAVAAGVLLAPRQDAPPLADGPNGTSREAPHRERAITTTAAPRLLPPVANGGDGVLRWTSVPYADRYEIRVFDRSGDLVWSVVSTDTSEAIPAHLQEGPRSKYLGKVEARTGWDRWVASEWTELTIGVEGSR